jgi:hypothetical protein
MILAVLIDGEPVHSAAELVRGFHRKRRKSRLPEPRVA